MDGTNMNQLLNNIINIAETLGPILDKHRPSIKMNSTCCTIDVDNRKESPYKISIDIYQDKYMASMSLMMPYNNESQIIMRTIQLAEKCIRFAKIVEFMMYFYCGTGNIVVEDIMFDTPD